MINIRNFYSIFKWLFLSILLAALDIGTKCWIKNCFLVGDVLYILPGINLCCVYNSGIAFGLFAYMNAVFQKILIGVIILIVVILCVSLYRAVLNQLICDSLSYSIIIGGTIGNLHDRILYGMVIDFIDCYIKNWHWPVFNVADIEICIGLIFLLVSRFIKLNHDH